MLTIEAIAQFIEESRDSLRFLDLNSDQLKSSMGGLIMSRTIDRILDTRVSRRAALHSAAGILGGAILPGGLILPA